MKSSSHRPGSPVHGDALDGDHGNQSNNLMSMGNDAPSMHMMHEGKMEQHEQQHNIEQTQDSHLEGSKQASSSSDYEPRVDSSMPLNAPQSAEPDSNTNQGASEATRQPATEMSPHNETSQSSCSSSVQSPMMDAAPATSLSDKHSDSLDSEKGSVKSEFEETPDKRSHSEAVDDGSSSSSPHKRQRMLV